MKATAKLSSSLQSVLVDLIELHLQGKQAHWNLVGTNFRDLHLQLDEIVLASRGFADEVAERMRALHAVPDGTTATVLKETSLPKLDSGLLQTTSVVDLIGERLEAVVATMRSVHDTVDDADPTSADLLHKIIEALEQFAWMIEAENMSPKAH